MSTVESLQEALKWECRPLWFIPIGLALTFISVDAAYAIIGISAIVVVTAGSVFSVVVVRLFYDPIGQARRLGYGKWGDSHAALFGVLLAVTSSSLLYINVAAALAVQKQFATSMWLHPQVFGVALDSIVGDIGMLAVSGLLTSMSNKASYMVSLPSEKSARSRRHSKVSPLATITISLIGAAATIPNLAHFVPPQEQPRALKLKSIARFLQDKMFQENLTPGGKKIFNHTARKLIDIDFVSAAKTFFEEIVEQARSHTVEMREEYHNIRKVQLAIYADALQQIRLEPTFVELHKRAEQLVIDIQTLERPKLQTANSICGIYESGEAVADRYDTFMTTVGRKSGATFHKAGRKGLVRVCEKIALTPEPNQWQPRRVCDVVRGTMECQDFPTMLNVLRLLRDLDVKLSASGQTGGITEKICVVDSKERFSRPTPGGWADLMINFRFMDDKHICEVQLVHHQMFTIRQNMGRHKLYAAYRAASELLKMCDETFENKSSRQEMKALEWHPDNRKNRKKLDGNHIMKCYVLTEQNAAAEKTKRMEDKVSLLEAQLSVLVGAPKRRAAMREGNAETRSGGVTRMMGEVLDRSKPNNKSRVDELGKQVARQSNQIDSVETRVKTQNSKFEALKSSVTKSKEKSHAEVPQHPATRKVSTFQGAIGRITSIERVRKSIMVRRTTVTSSVPLLEQQAADAFKCKVKQLEAQLARNAEQQNKAQDIQFSHLEFQVAELRRLVKSGLVDVETGGTSPV
jgi:hypothetical protein